MKSGRPKVALKQCQQAHLRQLRLMAAGASESLKEAIDRGDVDLALGYMAGWTNLQKQIREEEAKEVQ